MPQNGKIYGGEEISRALIRELTEEIGIHSNQITNSFILGVTRELVRGGEPELFMFVNTNCTEEEVTNSWSQAMDRHEMEKFSVYKFDSSLLKKQKFNGEDMMSFGLEVDKCVETYFEKASLPLLTALALWKKYIIEIKK